MFEVKAVLQKKEKRMGPFFDKCFIQLEYLVCPIKRSDFDITLLKV